MKDAAVLETEGNGERKLPVSGICNMYSKSWFINLLRQHSHFNSHFTQQIILARSEYGQSFFKPGGGGGTPYDGLYAIQGARLKKGIFSGFRYMKG